MTRFPILLLLPNKEDYKNPISSTSNFNTFDYPASETVVSKPLDYLAK